MSNTFHVSPVASDGQYTIGYDANGVAGQWSGNMAEIASDFQVVRAEASFHDGNEEWDAYEAADGAIVWRDGDGNWEDITAVLKRYGDR